MRAIVQEIVDKAVAGAFKAKPAKEFEFDDIRDAHEAMEANQSKEDGCSCLTTCTLLLTLKNRLIKLI
jgi:hypothetical protein